MPIFFQHTLDESAKLGVWKIEEDETFFLQEVMPQRDVTHPHKKLQHLAGRYLLKYLYPDFPLSLIRVADTRKPFLPDEAYHFSISHCGDYAAAIVSRDYRVGIDIEIPTGKILKIEHKFLHEEERRMINDNGLERTHQLTLMWCCKEAMFKWWGKGNIDFSKMLRVSGGVYEGGGILQGNFIKGNLNVFFPLQYRIFPGLILTWVATSASLHEDRLSMI
jgi:4'-phosphopantetheinyl transferase EntD